MRAMSRAVSLVLVCMLLALSASAGADFNETGYPIVNEPVTLTLMGSRASASAAPFSENLAFAYVEELTNVKFEYQDVDSASWNEKFNLTLASNDLPDIFTRCVIAPSVVMENIEYGTFLPLNDLIDAYGPNVKSVIDANPGIASAITLPDGTIPGLFQQANYTSEETTVMPTTAMMIYRPWLDSLGLEMPTTTEEYYQTLLAFKTQDPNGNGLADEIPLSPRNGQGDLYSLLNLFNISANRSYDCNYDEATGKVSFALMGDKYKDFLKYFKKLYAEGLLDNEVFTQNAQQVTAKASGEVPLVGSSVTGSPISTFGDERSKDVVPMPILESPYGERTWTRRADCYYYTFVITSANQHPEISMRWADYFYSEEGARLAWMGIEDEHWAWNEDGTWSFLVPDGETTNTLRSYCCLQPGGGIASAFPLIYYTKTTDAMEQSFIDFCYSYVDEPGEADLLLPQYPTVFYDEMAQKELTTYATDISTYANQMMAKFIVGESDIDADWDEYIATLNRMGLEDMLAIMQAAVDAL